MISRPDATTGQPVGETAVLSARAQAFTAVQRRAVQALAVEPVQLSACTHGGDCGIHPDVHGIHDFTPGAVQALAAVLVQVRYLPITEHTLRRIVASLGLDWADVERQA